MAFIVIRNKSLISSPQCFTAGRYEYRNKGVDMFIESLARKWFDFVVDNSSRLFL